MKNKNHFVKCVCGVVFNVAPSCNRKFCSRKCYYLFQSKIKKGKEITGLRVWQKINKGKIKHSYEHRRKLSLLSKGKPTWLSGKTGVYSEETLKKKRESARKGKDCHLWRGGITPEHTKIRMSLKYKLWRRQVFERDDFTCQGCYIRGSKGIAVYLQAHHILPFAYFPDKRFDITNGVTLCINCHNKVTLRDRKENVFQTKNL